MLLCVRVCVLFIFELMHAVTLFTFHKEKLLTFQRFYPSPFFCRHLSYQFSVKLIQQLLVVSEIKLLLFFYFVFFVVQGRYLSRVLNECCIFNVVLFVFLGPSCS